MIISEDRATCTCYRALGSRDITTCFYDLGMSRPGIELRSPACEDNALPLSHSSKPYNLETCYEIRIYMSYRKCNKSIFKTLTYGWLIDLLVFIATSAIPQSFYGGVNKRHKHPTLYYWSTLDSLTILKLDTKSVFMSSEATDKGNAAHRILHTPVYIFYLKYIYTIIILLYKYNYILFDYYLY